MDDSVSPSTPYYFLHELLNIAIAWKEVIYGSHFRKIVQRMFLSFKFI